MKRLQSKTMVFAYKKEKKSQSATSGSGVNLSTRISKAGSAVHLKVSDVDLKKVKNQEIIKSRKARNGPRLEQTFKTSCTVPPFSLPHLCFFSFSAKTGLWRAAPPPPTLEMVDYISKNRRLKKQNGTKTRGPMLVSLFHPTGGCGRSGSVPAFRRSILKRTFRNHIQVWKIAQINNRKSNSILSVP